MGIWKFSRQARQGRRKFQENYDIIQIDISVSNIVTPSMAE
jgi:hypothetical protein